MNILKEGILLSRKFNEGRNIFYYKDEEYPLGCNILNWMEKLEFIKLTEDEIIDISNFIVKQIKDILIDSNQYINFDEDLQKQIFNIYYIYFSKINLSKDKFLIKEYTKKYQRNLLKLFLKVPEIKVLDTNKENIEKVPCSQYSKDHQLEVLNIKEEELLEPVLDIGCGYDANLVSYLRSKGISSYGIDRKISLDKEYLLEKSWLDFSFVKDTWGIIIAHMSFTNHFKREHLKMESEYIKYAKKYMEILNSLKKGGKFIYTPSVEFIEVLLPKDEYIVKNFNISSGYLQKNPINSTMIIKK